MLSALLKVDDNIQMFGGKYCVMLKANRSRQAKVSINEVCLILSAQSSRHDGTIDCD